MHKLQARLHWMERIIEINRELASMTSVERVLNHIVQAAVELTDSEAAGLLLLDEKTNQLRFVAATHLANQLIDIPVPVQPSIAGAAFLSGQPLIVPDVHLDPRYYQDVELITGFRARSLLAVPLQFKQHRIGVLEVENKCGDAAFDQEDVDALMALAAQTTVTIETARLVEALQFTQAALQAQVTERERLLEAERTQRRMAEALRYAGTALSGSLDYDTVFDRILAQISLVVPHDAANVMLIEDNGIARVLRGHGYERFGTAETLTSTTLDPSKVAGLRHMQQTGLPMAVPDVTQDKNWVYSRPEHTWIKSYAGAPIVVRDQAVGFLNVISATPGFYSQADAERLQAFASHAAIAIENARLYHQAQQELAERIRAEQEVQKHRNHLEELVEARTTALTQAITEATRLNTQLGGEIAERERLITDLRAFSHTVAHDLKNPLSLVSGYSQLLLRQLAAEGDTRWVKLVEPINQAVHKLVRIVNELLILASVRQQDVTPQPLNMAAILTEVENRMGQTISESQAEMTKPATWPVALGHAPWVEEVWANYISNAIKYGGNPPRLELGAELVAGPPDQVEQPQVRFWVHDNGPGVSPQVQAHLFSTFTRFDETRATGHGLGLSIVKRIVDRLGGQVGVESPSDAGSTFYFTLPAASMPPAGQQWVNQMAEPSLLGQPLPLDKRDDWQTRPSSSSTTPSPASLLALPEAWVSGLYQAVVTGDLDDIAHWIKLIAQHDAALGKTLSDWANDFNHDAILNLIRTARRPA